VLDFQVEASRIEFGTGYFFFRSHPRAAEAFLRSRSLS